ADLLLAMRSLVRDNLSLFHREDGPYLGADLLAALTDAVTLTRGQTSLDAILRDVAKEPGKAAAPGIAVKLAFARAREVLLAGLGEHQDEEGLPDLWACLLHEMGLRGGSLEGQPAAERLLDRLRAEGHPLARLPLRLLALEDQLGAALRRYRVRSS